VPVLREGTVIQASDPTLMAVVVPVATVAITVSSASCWNEAAWPNGMLWVLQEAASPCPLAFVSQSACSSMAFSVRQAGPAPRPSALLGGRGAELEPQGLDHLQYGGHLRIPFRGKRPV